MCLSVVSNSPKLKKLGKCEGPQEKRLMDLGYLAGWLCLKWCTADFGQGSLGGGVPGSLDLGGCLGSQVLSYRPDQDGPLAVGLAILWDRPDGGFVCGWIKGLVLSWKIFGSRNRCAPANPPEAQGGPCTPIHPSNPILSPSSRSPGAGGAGLWHLFGPSPDVTGAIVSLQPPALGLRCASVSGSGVFPSSLHGCLHSITWVAR